MLQTVRDRQIYHDSEEPVRQLIALEWQWQEIQGAAKPRRSSGISAMAALAFSAVAKKEGSC